MRQTEDYDKDTPTYSLTYIYTVEINGETSGPFEFTCKKRGDNPIVTISKFSLK